MGAAITPAGTPASLSASIASSRFCGVGARGSIWRASPRSSVVTETKTLTRPSRAIGARRSRSRRMRFDLVTMVIGWRAWASVSISDRVMRYCRSIG